MTKTTYYDLNIVEGTDIVNPLIVDNPNYEKIDESLHKNAVSGVTLATEIANATVHAITRENSECSVIRFIATSVWKAGDTVTVDGVPVTALLPSGETLPDGAYVINANVLCILTGTNLTVFADRKKTDNANEIKYHDTNVGAALDTINNNLKDYVKVSTVTVTLNSPTQVTANQLANLRGTFNNPDGYKPLAIVMQFIGQNPAASSITYYMFGDNGSNWLLDMYVIPGATETLTSINVNILFSRI